MSLVTPFVSMIRAKTKVLQFAPGFKKKKKREREKSIFPNVTQLYVFAAILIRSNYFKLRIKLIRVVVTYRPKKKNRHIMPVDNQ